MRKPLFIFKNGYLKRKQNTIYFQEDTLDNLNILKNEIDNEELDDQNLTNQDQKPNSYKKYIPYNAINEIHIFSNSFYITKKFLDFISKHNILIHFYNYYGYYEGTYYPREFYNSGFILLKQVEHYLDNSKRIYLAKAIVIGAILNSLKVLNYYKNRGIDLDYEISYITSFLEKVNECKNIDELMAYEGNSKAIYYRAFNKIIKNDDFIFNKRSKRPPTDKINALISFGNSYLYSICLSEIYRTHLDPRIGFLHSATYRKFSLNLDISEIFKPIIVDRVILNLINKKVISEDDFNEDLGITYLNEDGKKKFIKYLEERLNTTINLKKINKVSYRRIIRMELYKIEKHLIGEEDFEAFVSDW
ncbi:MAG: type I-B CRISPR-associated endonuclease Cas1b [bacterium]|jgi:CRISPR-associated protein Cas1